MELPPDTELDEETLTEFPFEEIPGELCSDYMKALVEAGVFTYKDLLIHGD